MSVWWIMETSMGTVVASREEIDALNSFRGAGWPVGGRIIGIRANPSLDGWDDSQAVELPESLARERKRAREGLLLSGRDPINWMDNRRHSAPERWTSSTTGRPIK